MDEDEKWEWEWEWYSDWNHIATFECTLLSQSSFHKDDNKGKIYCYRIFFSISLTFCKYTLLDEYALIYRRHNELVLLKPDYFHFKYCGEIFIKKSHQTQPTKQFNCLL